MTGFYPERPHRAADIARADDANFYAGGAGRRLSENRARQSSKRNGQRGNCNDATKSVTSNMRHDGLLFSVVNPCQVVLGYLNNYSTIIRRPYSIIGARGLNGRRLGGFYLISNLSMPFIRSNTLSPVIIPSRPLV